MTSRKQQSSTLYVFSEESTGGRNNAEYVSISWCHHVPGTDYKQCSLYYIEVRCNPAYISIHIASLHIRSRPNFLHIDQMSHPQKKVMAVWVLRHGEEWNHDDVIKWKHFPRYWPFVRGIHRSTVNSPHKGQWRGALIFSLICVWINGWVNNREAGDLRRYHARHDVTVMINCFIHAMRILHFFLTAVETDSVSLIAHGYIKIMIKRFTITRYSNQESAVQVLKHNKTWIKWQTTPRTDFCNKLHIVNLKFC